MPLPSALTTPVPSTEQTERSLDTHRRPVILLPSASRREIWNVSPLTPMVTSLLLMVHSPLLSSKLQRTIQVSSLSSTAAFTVAVPLPFAVRTPFSETVTMDSSLLCHVIFAPSGAPVTERVYCSPAFMNVRSSLFSASSAGSPSAAPVPT